ncbi:hypothetical protein X975_17293, partial [Stegodyphus mimosarum]
MKKIFNPKKIFFECWVYLTFHQNRKQKTRGSENLLKMKRC